MSIIFNSADIADTMNNGVSNVTGADSTITENYTNVVQHGIKIDMSVSEKTISGTPPLRFNSNGTPLIDYTIYGNTTQAGTPTPDSPVAVNGVGNVVSGNYVIPIATNVTTNIHLNNIQTTRKVKKMVLDGTESFINRTGEPSNVFFLEIPNREIVNYQGICTHYINQTGNFSELEDKHFLVRLSSADNKWFLGFRDSDFTQAANFKTFLAAQYANGTPVTIWYVLSEPETATVNEPLMKIGDYADSVSYSQAGVTIPTASGNNTLDIQTTPKPSNISITYKGR